MSLCKMAAILLKEIFLYPIMNCDSIFSCSKFILKASSISEWKFTFSFKGNENQEKHVILENLNLDGIRLLVTWILRELPSSNFRFECRFGLSMSDGFVLWDFSVLRDFLGVVMCLIFKIIS